MWGYERDGGEITNKQTNKFFTEMGVMVQREPHDDFLCRSSVRTVGEATRTHQQQDPFEERTKKSRPFVLCGFDGQNTARHEP